MKLMNTIVAIFYLTASLFAGETVKDIQVGYSVQLPGTWIHKVTSTTHHQFIDTTGTYQSIIAISRYDFASSTTFATADEWTRANFIAYKLTNDADPLSLLAFYDTVSAWQNGTIWAADAYTYYFDTDTAVGDWAEYIRFTAVETRGYEIYAIGPAIDLDSNIATYATIMESIALLDSDGNIGIKHKLTPARLSATISPRLHQVNILGRSIKGRNVPIASQLIVTPKDKLVRLRY
jgi:hypothetical protein